MRNGEVLLHTDGPFAETKEQLGGFYAIEVADLDPALMWAAKIPSANIGTIEVLPEWAT
ncbi:MAG: YciI family protein [Planctomycetota bacterium]|nr:YciI family protein [Planctomycetota bacterium]MDA1113980.1 YciI family protein [Planctomycetota bacterium]